MLRLKINSEELLFYNQHDLEKGCAYCEYCHERYEVRPGVGNGKRRPCKIEQWQTGVADEVVLPCLNCGKDFVPKKLPAYHQKGKRLFCSRKCSASFTNAKAIARARTTSICERCKRPFEHYKRLGQRFCTKRCARQAIGESRRKVGKCFTCGTKISIPPHRLKYTRQFCSRRCADQNRTKRNSKEVNCPWCGVVFRTTPGPDRKFCSRKCASNFRKQKTAEEREASKIILKCKTCLKSFGATPKELDEGRTFCSMDCQNNRDVKIASNCVFCGAEFSDYAYNFHKRKRQYCSTSCSAKDRPRTRIRPPDYPPEFNEEFKEKVRCRDGYKCMLCLRPGKDVHHINYDKFDTRMENCVYLCRKCHMKTNHNRTKWPPMLERIIERYRLGLHNN